MNQLAEHSWSHFCYSPLITRGFSWHSTVGHTSVTLHSSPVDQLAEHSWSHFCYSPLIIRGSAGRVLLITLRLLSTITRGSAGRAHLVSLLLLSTHYPWISWQSTAGHTSVTLHSSPVDQLAEYSYSYFCYCPLINRGSAAEYSWSHFCYSPLITR